jgi:hypothetical protein
MQRWLWISLLVGLSACATSETWIPPADRSDLQVQRDLAECERYVARTAETDINTCMEKMGYKKKPH